MAKRDYYETLGVAKNATEDVIKKAYRKLSLLKHPDRNPDDPLAATEFIQITKAYTSLTDETAKANYEKYGNPDGPQAMEAAIGLPSFLVHPVGRYVFLLSYMLILLLVVPYVLYRFFKSRGSGQAQAEGLAAALGRLQAGQHGAGQALWAVFGGQPWRRIAAEHLASLLLRHLANCRRC